MTKIRTCIILIFLVLGIQNASAQVYKFKTTGFSVLEKNTKGKWGKWSDLQKAAIIISLDTSKNRIIVYSQEVQLYKIIKYRPNEENEKDLIYAFDCIDENGQDFTISIITRKSQDNRKQLYINQKDVIIVYNIVNFVE